MKTEMRTQEEVKIFAKSKKKKRVIVKEKLVVSDKGQIFDRKIA